MVNGARLKYPLSGHKFHINQEDYQETSIWQGFLYLGAEEEVIREGEDWIDALWCVFT